MKRLLAILLLASTLSEGQAQAQNIEGTIGTSELKSIRESYKKDNYTKAMENALSGNSINSIAFNNSIKGKDDQNFTYRVNVKGITNQKSSGRCWMFTSLNIFRPTVMKKLNLDNFEFSQNHLYFWDIFEKSNLFLNNIISTTSKPIDDRVVQWYFASPADDGGVWNSFVNLVQKYGVVPKDVEQETYSSENTRYMVKHIKTKLRGCGMRLREMASNGAAEEELQETKIEMLKDIYRMLALNLGEPVESFQWRYKAKDSDTATEYKTYTPQSFRDEMLGAVEWDDYVMIMHDPMRPYYNNYEIKNYRNVEEGINWGYINLPNSVIKEAAIRSIKGNEAMYGSCDVGAMLNRDYGILDMENYDYESVYGVSLSMTKKERIESRESGSSHGMALIAVDVDSKGVPTKWQFENSWGTSAGHNGYLSFTDEWFDNYMFRFVIKKQYLDAKTVKALENKKEILPEWDFMF